MTDQPVTVTPGQPRPAGSCAECQRPSLVTVDLYAMTDDGPVSMGSWTGCAEEHCDFGVNT